MFKLVEEPIVSREILVQIPSGRNNNTWQEHKFIANFCVLNDDTWNSVVDQSDDNVTLDAILVGVEGIADENDEEMLPEKALMAVKRNAFTRRAVLSAYIGMLQKNFQSDKPAKRR